MYKDTRNLLNTEANNSDAEQKPLCTFNLPVPKHISPKTMFLACARDTKYSEKSFPRTVSNQNPRSCVCKHIKITSNETDLRRAWRYMRSMHTNKFRTQDS